MGVDSLYGGRRGMVSARGVESAFQFMGKNIGWNIMKKFKKEGHYIGKTIGRN